MHSFLLKQAYIIDKDSCFYSQFVDVLVKDGVICTICPSSSKELATNPSNLPIINADGLQLTNSFVDLYCHLPLHNTTTLNGISHYCAMPNNLALAQNNQISASTIPNAKTLSFINLTNFNQQSPDFIKSAFGISNGKVAIADSKMLLNVMHYAASINIPIFLQPIEPSIGVGDRLESANCWRLGLLGSHCVAEEIDLYRIIALAKQTKCKLHISLLATAAGVELLAQEQAKGLDISADVAIANLLLNESDMVDYDNSYKMLPPLGSKQDQETLIKGLEQGIITAISSNHTPMSICDKNQPFDKADFGIHTVDYMLSLLLDLADKNKLAVADVLSWFSTKPANVLGINNSIAINNKANFLLFDPKDTWKLTANKHMHSQATPWLNKQMLGTITHSVINGFLKTR